MIAFWLGWVACGEAPPHADEEPCRRDRDCDVGFVCVLFEDSLDGRCASETCADRWNGYDCDTGAR